MASFYAPEFPHAFNVETPFSSRATRVKKKREKIVASVSSFSGDFSPARPAFPPPPSTVEDFPAPPPPLVGGPPPRFRPRPPPPSLANPPHLMRGGGPGFRHQGPRGPWNQPPPPPPPMHAGGSLEPPGNAPPFPADGGHLHQPPLQGPPLPPLPSNQLPQNERMGGPFPGRNMSNQEFIRGNVSYSRLHEKGGKNPHGGQFKFDCSFMLSSKCRRRRRKHHLLSFSR